MVLRGWVLLCPSRPLDTAVLSCLNEGAEGRILRGLVLLGPLPPSRYCCYLSLLRGRKGYGPTGSGTVVPPPSILIPLFPREKRAGTNGVWYCWAPSLPLDNDVFSRFHEGVKGMVLRGLVLLCPLPRSLYCCFSRFDEGVEGMILRGLVLLCPLPPT